MFRRIAPFLAALGALLLPATAQAHHITNMRASCTLVRNVPTLTFGAEFVNFSDVDQHRHVVVKVDDDVKVNTDVFFDSDDYTWTKSLPSTPGTHDIDMLITWMHYDGDHADYNNASLSKRVICPPPVPPPVVCKPGTVPGPIGGPVCVVPPPHVVCGPGTMPTPTPTGTVCLVPKPKPCGCKPHPKPRPKPKPHRVSCKISYFNHDPLPGDTRPWAHTSSVSGCRIRVMRPHITHGRQVFAVSCPGGVLSARWWVDGKRIRNHHWTHLTHGGRHLSSYLFDQKVWGHWLWGRHTVSVSVRVR